MSELRWHPLLKEWVITATHRQDRTFLPPRDYCPLCPTKSGRHETEIPVETFDIAVFENKFPSLQRKPPQPAIEPMGIFDVRPAEGVCEVVVYTPEHDTTLTDQSVSHIRRLIAVWRDRYMELGNLPYVKYVFIFENKGEVIGVTLHHPHGQIYAYPFIPPLMQRELSALSEHQAKTGRCLVCEVLEQEVDYGKRILFEEGNFVAFIPFYARWPYEVHIIPKRHFGSLAEITSEESWDLAYALKRVLVGYDKLFGFSMPFIMALHQTPTDDQEHPYYHFQLQFYPPHRTSTKLKYLAGSETGAGTFINDSLPEEKAPELRAVIPDKESIE